MARESGAWDGAARSAAETVTTIVAAGTLQARSVVSRSIATATAAATALAVRASPRRPSIDPAANGDAVTAPAVKATSSRAAGIARFVLDRVGPGPFVKSFSIVARSDPDKLIPTQFVLGPEGDDRERA